MNVKSAEKVLKKPICTWLSEADHARFVRAAALQGTKPATYLRSIVTDAIAEDEARAAAPFIARSA